MDRITRPNVSVSLKAARFMDEPAVKIPEIGDQMLHLILNGPTLNSVNKYILRSMVRQLYDALKAYEDTGRTPEELDELLYKTTGPFHKKIGEWMKAEAESRLIVVSIKPGDTLYWVLEDNGKHYVASERIVDVATRGLFVPEYAGGDIESPCDFVPWDAIGKECFLTEEEANAALGKLKED